MCAFGDMLIYFFVKCLTGDCDVWMLLFLLCSMKVITLELETCSGNQRRVFWRPAETSACNITLPSARILY